MTTEDAIIAEVSMPLTTQEQTALVQHETIIERGLHTFVEVGEALAVIREQRLYRSTHGDFADYIRERWPQIGSRRQADRLIGAAEVERDLRPIGLSLGNEAQARPLVALAPDERREAMQAAVAAAPDGKPTAAHVQRAAESVRPPPAKAAVPSPASARPTQPAPAPTALPTLTPLPTALPQALPLSTANDSAALKLLYAKERLLASALEAVRSELGARPDIEQYQATVNAGAVTDAVRTFLQSPGFSGAAGMLAFATTIEELVVAE